jgi:hypothetical protein
MQLYNASHDLAGFDFDFCLINEHKPIVTKRPGSPKATEVKNPVVGLFNGLQTRLACF